jgi:hypothetical protein
MVFVIMACNIADTLLNDDKQDEIQVENTPVGAPTTTAAYQIPAGESLITYVESPGIGNIAVRIQTPKEPRYPLGAPIIVNIDGFFTPSLGFNDDFDVTAIGAVNVDYLWPGIEDRRFNASSEGTFDHGGPICLSALRDIIRFALGEIQNVDGYYIQDLVEIPLLEDNLGLYAFSHSGIVGSNVLAYFGGELTNVKFFVGRENPTIDPMYALEMGHFDEDQKAVINPYYHPGGYTSRTIDFDYSTVGWIQNDDYPNGRPFFSVSDGPDFVLGEKGPTMWGKKYFSIGLTQALLDNGALVLESWPADLATPEETKEHWPYRTTVDNYATIREHLPDLKVMLIFAAEDHVQAVWDKPHIHQAYDGFSKTAGLWVRLNPDQAYVASLMDIDAGGSFPDNPANSEPDDWMDVRSWGYHAPRMPKVNEFVPLAGIAEIVDRVYSGNWENNLERVLHQTQ